MLIVQPSSIIPQDITPPGSIDTDFTVTTTGIDISFLVLNSDSSLVDTQTIGTDFVVLGDTSLSNLITSQSTLNGSTNMNGECLMTGNFTVDGKLSVFDTVDLRGNIGLNGIVDVSGSLLIGENYYSNGNIVL